MKILIVGASGATGKLLVEQLLNSGQSLKVILRATSKIPDAWNNNTRLTIIRVNALTEISPSQMAAYLEDCHAAASCLGHNLSLKGIYGEPRKLVTATTQLICEAALQKVRQKPFRFILMNTAGNSNRNLNEPLSFAQKTLISLLGLLLPPHTDNENAADYLRLKIGQRNPGLEWVAVRPDNLTDAEIVTAYSLFASPVRSALFNPGQTSRLNVAHFIAQLSTDEPLWNSWKGQMPVIYNQ